MNVLIDRLIAIESKAASVYEKAANHFSDNEELADFVRGLAMDEESHIDYFCKASELIENKRSYSLNVSMDKGILHATENFFSLCEKRIDENSLTKENLIDCITAVEFSEFDQICLSVIRILSKDFKEFIPAIVNIQKHIKKIERFIESDPELHVFLDRIRRLPSVWQEKLLVVDDDVLIADLLETIFTDEYDVIKASNGKEALKIVGDKYFTAIITDVDMPVMNGIEFYNKAVEMYPNIKDRFLFFTGSLDDERESFFRDNNLRHLTKPANPSDIKRAVADILTM